MGTTTRSKSEPEDGPPWQRFMDPVRDAPWIDAVVRMGWLSRGVVYVVVGLTAISVAAQRAPVEDEASPTGALGRIASLTAGRLLLAILVVGMVLYVGFQLFSLVLIRGNGLDRWWRRAGHLVASATYSLFAWSAAGVALSGESSSGTSLIESISRSVLESTTGRWFLGLCGLVIIGAGAYYVFRHVVQRGFVEGLIGVEPDLPENGKRSRAILVAGVVGWVGRATVIALIGFFVTRAAITFDPNEARGFDRALRQTAGSTAGSLFVLLCGIGLLTYGAFCIASHRRRTIRDNESD